MYLHCHSCNWEQDDFWSRHYNPLTVICSDVRWLGRPRMMELDRPRRVFSWGLFLTRLVSRWKTFRRQEWWTLASWRAAEDDGAVCPNCGARDFDID